MKKQSYNTALTRVVTRVCMNASLVRSVVTVTGCDALRSSSPSFFYFKKNIFSFFLSSFLSSPAVRLVRWLACILPTILKFKSIILIVATGSIRR